MEEDGIGSTVIEVEGLSVSYDNEVVLKDVSFEVHRGEILVVAGTSGSGKSTLLRHMIGLARPSSGRVVINGVDMTNAGDVEGAAARRRVGMLFQSSGLLGSMTLAENITLPLAEFTDLSEALVAVLVRLKLSMVGLSGYERYFPSELSGGMRKRAGIARAMALDPEILFLDEPFAGLDPITSAGLELLVERLNQGMGTTMVIVSHELDAIFRLAQRIVMLDKVKKGIIAEGDPRALRDRSPDPRVRQFFNRQIDEGEERGRRGA